MTRPDGSGPGALRRARIALKRFAYSGLGRDRWQAPDRVVGELALKPGDRVADLGAGGGYFTFRLARAVGDTGVVYAVDTDADMRSGLARRAAREGLGNVVVVAADADGAGLPEALDLVFMVNAYHHIPGRHAYFADLKRSLKPSGRLAVVEARPGRLQRFWPHSTAPEAIRSELEAAGYRLVAEHAFLPRQGFLVFEPAGTG